MVEEAILGIQAGREAVVRKREGAAEAHELDLGVLFKDPAAAREWLNRCAPQSSLEPTSLWISSEACEVARSVERVALNALVNGILFGESRYGSLIVRERARPWVGAQGYRSRRS